jgi:DNA repair ATPase RecN|tara:strand:+ start:1675 stop:1872 length:198 start_codon:yes stop_codon:yes gene_type:complete
MKEEKLYLETLKEIKEMKQHIADDLDSLYLDIQNLKNLKYQIMELQEEVAKLAGVPVGMLFAYRG